MNELEKTDQIVGVGFETKLLLVGKVFHQEIKCLKNNQFGPSTNELNLKSPSCRSQSVCGFFVVPACHKPVLDGFY